jgi:peptidoglycan-N-acetylmuramic acid deacetylase
MQDEWLGFSENEIREWLNQDYNVDNQPDPEYSKAALLKNTRDGMICLLHAVSKTNATILDSLIKEWKNRGYEFKTLDDLPN